ncbi:winged helix-turn-helix transcriptional regulator [Candidatus Pacearchaeota archaeon]|nr:winged helix-turn-helix transcriptional regulator [Candidatus Pacearchaeota archaeon]
MRCKLILFCAVLLALISFSQAATIYGNVYGPDLTMLKYSIIEINSTPNQNMVAINGNYSFNLPQGVYEINAIYRSKTINLITRETITVNSDGNFVHDLILFNTEDVENITFDEGGLINDTINQSARPYEFAMVLIVILISLIILFIYLIRKRKKQEKEIKKSKNKRIISKKKKIEEISNDEVLNKIYDIIKREKRVNQKEIRKEIGMSEAKISLVIADLESRGLVKKIKAGRGNIVILQTKIE